MKNLFRFASLAVAGLGLAAMTACSTSPVPVSISGELAGAPDGTIVRLLDLRTYPAEVMDSTFTKDGKFKVQAKTLLAEPEFLQISAMPPLSPEQQKDMELVAENYRGYRFYAENAEMTFTCPFESMPYFYWMPGSKKAISKPEITGSVTEAEHDEYKKAVGPYTGKYSALHTRYYGLLYPDDEVPVAKEKIMEVVREMDEVAPQCTEAKIAFFKAHPASYVTLCELRGLLLSHATELTKEQIDQLLQIPAPELKSSNTWKELEEASAKAYALCKGTKYTDGPALDLKGNKVKLSDYIQPGKYNMLEFWASWCGPCRGEIPHLRRVYQLSKGTNFNIISISIDAKDADWQKAVKEENMEWTQLRCGDQSRNEELAKSYYINGVPFSVVLDPDGKIVCGHLRGMQLDYFLEKVLGLDL